MTTTDKPNLRYYWIIFGTLLLSFGFPLRILSHWWINPVLYGLLAFGCLVITIRFIRLYHWKQAVVILMLACVTLSGWQSLISVTEINSCWVEDTRYTQLIVCDGGGHYQQIEKLPIGMQGYCYYCLWYE